MKKVFLTAGITMFLMACGNGSESSAITDSTVNSTTPPPTSDTLNVIGAMMGDTSTMVADSINK